MQWRPARLALALAIFWGACEDRTIELAHPVTGSGTQGSTSTSTAADTGTTSSGGPLTSSTTPGFGLSSAGGSSNSNTDGPFGPSATAAGGSVGHDSGPSTDGGGTGPSATSGGGESGGDGGDDCDPTDFECLACTIARTCRAPTPDCMNNPEWLAHWSECHECISEADSCIQNGLRCFDESGNCHPQCTETAECEPGLVCHPEAGVCLQCYDDSQCFGIGHCLAGKCAACRTGSDCPPPSSYCIAGLCRACVSDAECVDDPNATRCDGYTCVACLENDDCTDGQTCMNGSCLW